MPTIELTAEELATVLDALAAYGDRRRQGGGWGVAAIARWEHFTEVPPMEPKAIEELYYRLKEGGGA